jgi:hypothetical protein
VWTLLAIVPTKALMRAAGSESRRERHPKAALPSQALATEASPDVQQTCDLDTDALSELLTVVGGVAQEQFRRFSSFEVQVSVVFPGEADATVDLDVFG